MVVTGFFAVSCILRICGGNTQDRNCIFYQKMDKSSKNQRMCFFVDINVYFEEVYVDSANKTRDTGMIHLVLA